MFDACLSPGPQFNIKMSSYQYRKSHCGDKTVVRSSYLHNGISYTGKMSSLYWIGAQSIIWTHDSVLSMKPMEIIFNILTYHIHTSMYCLMNFKTFPFARHCNYCCDLSEISYVLINVFFQGSQIPLICWSNDSIFQRNSIWRHRPLALLIILTSQWWMFDWKNVFHGNKSGSPANDFKL